jgi:hypothetical protein
MIPHRNGLLFIETPFPEWPFIRSEIKNFGRDAIKESFEVDKLLILTAFLF